MLARAALALAALAALLLAAPPPAAAQATCMLPLEVGGTAPTFASCITVPGVGDGFQLFWTLAPGGANVSWGMYSAGAGYGAGGGCVVWLGSSPPGHPAPPRTVRLGTQASALRTCSASTSVASRREPPSSCTITLRTWSLSKLSFT